jgi:uncharacterized membrane protein
LRGRKNTSERLGSFRKTTELDTYDRALEVFHELKMDETELKNGVLIYLAVKDQTFVIWGSRD